MLYYHSTEGQNGASLFDGVVSCYLTIAGCKTFARHVRANDRRYDIFQPDINHSYRVYGFMTGAMMIVQPVVTRSCDLTFEI
jgi:hypothetical protein